MMTTKDINVADILTFEDREAIASIVDKRVAAEYGDMYNIQLVNESIRSLPNTRNIMSTPHAQERLLDIFEEVKEAFPYYDEDKQIEIANKRLRTSLYEGRLWARYPCSWGVLRYSCTIFVILGRDIPPPRHPSRRLISLWQDVTLKTEYESLTNGKPLTS